MRTAFETGSPVLVHPRAFFASDGGEVVGGELDADDLIAGGAALDLDAVEDFFLGIEAFERGESDLGGVAAGAGGAVAGDRGQAGRHDRGDANIRGGFGAGVGHADFVGRFAADF